MQRFSFVHFPPMVCLCEGKRRSFAICFSLFALLLSNAYATHFQVILCECDACIFPATKPIYYTWNRNFDIIFMPYIYLYFMQYAGTQMALSLSLPLHAKCVCVLFGPCIIRNSGKFIPPPNFHAIDSIQALISISIPFLHPATFRCHQGYANELHFNMNRILITFHCTVLM